MHRVAKWFIKFFKIYLIWLISNKINQSKESLIFKNNTIQFLCSEMILQLNWGEIGLHLATCKMVLCFFREGTTTVSSKNHHMAAYWTISMYYLLQIWRLIFESSWVRWRISFQSISNALQFLGFFSNVTFHLSFCGYILELDNFWK